MAYYFANTDLPPLTLGLAPEMGFNEAKEMLRLNLSMQDMEQVEQRF
ncbi:MAG: hypothetical protein HY069_03955 [Chlamydiia bacterium]|nr:hypothetical protein [Chlamydiia bacterium]